MHLTFPPKAQEAVHLDIFSWVPSQRTTNQFSSTDHSTPFVPSWSFLLSASKAELVPLFLNMKAGKIFQLNLNEIGHPQPPTPIRCDNITTAGIANNTVKKDWSGLMEMKYFGVCNQVKIGGFAVFWHPGKENLVDYTGKHHNTRHHKNIRPLYLH